MILRGQLLQDIFTGNGDDGRVIKIDVDDVQRACLGKGKTTPSSNRNPRNRLWKGNDFRRSSRRPIELVSFKLE